MPQNRLGDTQTAVVVDDKIYFLRHDFSYFDPSTGEVTEKALFTLPYKSMKKGDDCLYDVATLQGEVYVVGGVHLLAGSRKNKTEYNFVEIYNPTNDSWRNGTVPNRQIGYFPAVTVAGGELYLLDRKSGYFEMYNPSSNCWTTKTPLPLWNFVSNNPNVRVDQIVVVNDRIYCFTYPDYNSPPLTLIYDTKTDTWYRGDSPPVPDSQASFSVFAFATTGHYAPQRIYYVGMATYSPADAAFNYAYNPADNSWSSAQPLLAATPGYHGGAVVNDQAYFFVANGVEVYTPVGFSTSPLAPLPSPANPDSDAILLPRTNPIIFVQAGVGFVIVASIVLATIYLRKYKNKK